MSATDPAGPTPPPIVNTTGRAPVISLDSARTGHRPWRGRRHTLSAPPTPPTGPRRGRSAHEQFADDVEAWFNGIDRTLSDEDTALIFAHSVDVFAHLLKGAAANGVISEEQRADLQEMLDGLKQVPGLV